MKKNKKKTASKKPSATLPPSFKDIRGNLLQIQDAIWQLEEKVGKPGCISGTPADAADDDAERAMLEEERDSNARYAVLVAEMIKDAQPLVKQLQEKPSSLPNDVWLCHDHGPSTVAGFLVSRRGDPADMIAWVECDLDLDDADLPGTTEVESLNRGRMHEYLCAAVMIAMHGKDAGEAAWAHVANMEYGDVESPRPVPSRLFSLNLKHPFADSMCGEEILLPLCRFRFAKMLQRFVDRRFARRGETFPTRQYVVGFIDETTNKPRLATLSTGASWDLSVGEIGGWR